MHRSLSEWLFFIPFSTIPHPVSFICLVPHSFRCRVVVKPENVLFQVRQDELQVTFSWPEIKAGGNFGTLRNSARLRECPKLKLWQQSKETVLPKNAYCRKHTYFQKHLRRRSSFRLVHGEWRSLPKIDLSLERRFFD
jgi:hypothetical protein